MDKGLTVPELVLRIRPKIPQMPQNLSTQYVCDYNEKTLHWVSVVRDSEAFGVFLAKLSATILVQ